nr:MAG TPA: hypothetical protein [Caudoviricetes sp.]
MPIILGHAVNFCQRINVGCQTTQILDIHIVHADNQVETIEIFPSYLTGAMLERIASAGSMRTHTGIGQVAGMSAVCPGRIDYKQIGQSPFFYQMPHDTFGRRRAAYIPQTDKKYTIRTGGIGGRSHMQQYDFLKFPAKIRFSTRLSN